MPTPIYALRMSQEEQDSIAQMAKVFGAPNGRAFAREVLAVMCSGDVKRVQEFNARLIRGVGEQLTLALNAPLAELGKKEAKQQAARRVKRRKSKGGMRGTP